MIKCIKNNQGMTFVELMVGLLIFTVIATSVTAILAPTLKIYAKANDLAEINTVFNNLSDEILSELWNANGVTVSGAALTINTNRGSVVYDIGTATNAGILCKGRSGGTDMIPVLDQRYYKGKTVSLAYYGMNNSLSAYDRLIQNGSFSSDTLPGDFIIRITLSDQNGVMASRDYAVKPLGLNQHNMGSVPEPE